MKRILFAALLLLAAPAPALAEKFFLSGAGSNVIRVFIEDTSKIGTDQEIGLTALAFNTSNLEIHFICDTEATDTDYTAAGSTIETITTLGTYAAPTATKIRFKEVDATDLKGIYEIQVADARVVSTATACIVSWRGNVTNMRAGFKEIPVLAATPAVDCAKWNGTAVASPHTAGYPICTVKDGTGTGEIDTASGVIASVTTATTCTNLTTNNDKTGYSLLQSFPSNFSSLAITGGGAVTAGTVSDKTGYSLSGTQTFNVTGNVTGNLSGSVGSVTGAVGSVTGAVGSVTGNVGGNVTGSVGSVVGNVGGDIVGDLLGSGGGGGSSDDGVNGY